MQRLLATPAMLACLTLSGCGDWQSALDPRGPQADTLSELFWIFSAVATVVWVLVLVGLAVALLKRKEARSDPLVTDPATERRYAVVVSALVGLTAVTLIVLTGFSYATQKALFSGEPSSLTIRITGHQWWWDVRYEDAEPSQIVTTANEIHVPVGETVTLKLTSADVIHSFWVPSLAGKQDLIPGRENQLQFSADRTGVYRGQCAEFCGWQHAHMGIVFIVEEREEFEAWRQAQLAPRVTPGDEERRRGEAVFLANPCVACHTVRGTPAGSRVGPDLTHVGSRSTIAAGTLPLSRGTLAAWVVDPQGIKPGAHMPLVKLAPEDVGPLSAYLEGLK